MQEPYEDNDFDPYDTLMELTNFVHHWSVRYNELVEDYQTSLKRIDSLERQVLVLSTILESNGIYQPARGKR